MYGVLPKKPGFARYCDLSRIRSAISTVFYGEIYRQLIILNCPTVHIRIHGRVAGISGEGIYALGGVRCGLSPETGKPFNGDDGLGLLCIRLEGVGDDGQVKIRVANRGPGIAADKLDKVFDRFYRGEEAAVSPGFGLGLPIAKSLTEGVGGTIAIKSELGQGSTIILRFSAKGEFKLDLVDANAKRLS